MKNIADTKILQLNILERTCIGKGEKQKVTEKWEWNTDEILAAQWKGRGGG